MQQKSTPPGRSGSAPRLGLVARIRNAIAPPKGRGRSPGRSAPGHPAHASLAKWASIRGLRVVDAPKDAFVLEGTLAGGSVRMEQGPSTRDFIRGEELRARAELALDDGAAVIVMNRALKASLEQSAYGVFTDDLETRLKPSLSEEMRWLAAYDEVGWSGPQEAFWKQYAVLSNRREQAQAWIAAELADMLLARPALARGEDLPFMLLAMRGRCYLRMQLPAGAHGDAVEAAEMFASACRGAAHALAPQRRASGAPR